MANYSVSIGLAIDELIDAKLQVMAGKAKQATELQTYIDSALNHMEDADKGRKKLIYLLNTGTDPDTKQTA